MTIDTVRLSPSWPGRFLSRFFVSRPPADPAGNRVVTGGDAQRVHGVVSFDDRLGYFAVGIDVTVARPLAAAHKESQYPPDTLS